MNPEDESAPQGVTATGRFIEACRRFDLLNAEDPHLVRGDEGLRPRELVHAEQLTKWVLKLLPSASEALRLAARCQHVRRWMVPRSNYPLTRAGYLEWRSTLMRFHADQSAIVLREVGYPESLVQRVSELNLKRNMGKDPEMQVLEDALCLVFLESQFADLAQRTDEEKTINALRKTWRKMSDTARDFALQLQYEPFEQALLQRALAECVKD